MHTLENSVEIKEFVLTNIKPNLPRVDADSMQKLLKEISLDVCAKSSNEKLNKNFNSLIASLTKMKTQKVITIYHLTDFFIYYNQILKTIEVSFISSL